MSERLGAGRGLPDSDVSRRRRARRPASASRGVPDPALGDRRRARRAGEDGTVLILVPVGLLIIILLGAVAFDLALAFAGERRVADLAASWANDAVASISDDAFYTAGQVVEIDLERARDAVEARLDALDDPGLTIDGVRVDRLDPVTLRVTVTGRVPLLFLDAVPGMGERVVESTSVVSLVVT